METIPLAAVLRRTVRAHALDEPAGGVVEAALRAGSVYASVPTCHYSLAARVDAYAPELLDRAIIDERSLVRTGAMRGSGYLLTPALLPYGLALARPGIVRAMVRAVGVDDLTYQRLAQRIEDRLADQARSSREVRAALGDDAPESQALALVLRLMAREARIVSARAVGAGRSNTFRYAPMAGWLAMPPTLPPETEALAVMAELWLAANGPGSVADLAWWAGVKLDQARTALDALGTVVVAIAGIPGEQHTTDAQLAQVHASCAEKGAPSPARLLPYWDTYLMARRERSRYLAPERLPYVVDRSGNVTNTIVADGRVVGVWDIRGQELLYACWEPIEVQAIEWAAVRISGVTPFGLIRRVNEPIPLAAGGQNALMAPLRR